jgi:hypothetical protein
VNVAETVIDASHIQDEQARCDIAVHSVVQRCDSMQRDLHIFKEATKSKTNMLESENRDLERCLEASRKDYRETKIILEQVTQMLGLNQARLGDLSLERGKESRPSRLDDQVQQQDSQLCREVSDHQGEYLDSRLGHNYDTYGFDHEVSDGEVMADVQYEEEHDRVTMIDHCSLEDIRSPGSLQLDHQVQQQDSQVDGEVHEYQEGSLDYRLGHDYDAYGFDHRASGDENMDDVEHGEEHDPDTDINHDSLKDGRRSYFSPSDSHIQQQDFQVYHEEVQDSGSEDDIAAYNSRLRVIAKNNDYDDEALEAEANHEPATLHNVEEAIRNRKIEFRLNGHGDLYTPHTRSYYMVVILREMNKAWAPQKQEFIDQGTAEGLNWPFIELKKASSKCMRTACFPRSQKWTKDDSGEYVCSNCTNTMKICFGLRNGHWEALPILREAIPQDNPTHLQLYFAETKNITRTLKCGHLYG